MVHEMRVCLCAVRFRYPHVPYDCKKIDCNSLFIAKKLRHLNRLFGKVFFLSFRCLLFIISVPFYFSLRVKEMNAYDGDTDEQCSGNGCLFEEMWCHK